MQMLDYLSTTFGNTNRNVFHAEMKVLSWLVLLFLLLVPMTGIAQIDHDLWSYRPAGARTVTVTTRYLKAPGDTALTVRRSEFDTSGRIQRDSQERRYRSGNSASQRIYEYDSVGRETGYTKLGTSGLTEYVHTNLLDSSGRRIGWDEFHPYDNSWHGRFTFNRRGDLIATLITVNGSFRSLDSFAVDERGKRRGQRGYASDGSLIEQVTMKFDEDDPLVEYLSWRGDTIDWGYSGRYVYDSVGRLVRQIDYAAGGSVLKTIETIYDTEGHKSQRLVYSGSGELVGHLRYLYNGMGRPVRLVGTDDEGRWREEDWEYEYFDR